MFVIPSRFIQNSLSVGWFGLTAFTAAAVLYSSVAVVAVVLLVPSR
jgi:hypothetical protein